MDRISYDMFLYNIYNTQMYYRVLSTVLFYFHSYMLDLISYMHKIVNINISAVVYIVKKQHNVRVALLFVYNNISNKSCLIDTALLRFKCFLHLNYICQHTFRNRYWLKILYRLAMGHSNIYAAVVMVGGLLFKF